MALSILSEGTELFFGCHNCHEGYNMYNFISKIDPSLCKEYTLEVFKENAIEIRASSLPSEYGEAIVMRILDPQNLINVESLGLRNDMIKVFNKEIDKPNGMIIVTGPTGSGKTTTLSALLKQLAIEGDRKIISIEDPVEYHIQGVSHLSIQRAAGTEVSDSHNPFAIAMMAFLRMDPDVGMFGEIRDSLSAQIAAVLALGNTGGASASRTLEDVRQSQEPAVPYPRMRGSLLVFVVSRAF